MSNRSLANLLQTMTPAVRQSPLRALFLAVAVALCGLMTVADLPSPSPVHAQEQQVTPTKESTGAASPERPADLEASASHDSVSLTWTASTDDSVTHYAVLRRDRNADASGVFHVIDSNAGPGTSYTDDSVSAEGSYVYRVKAVSPTGVSQWSSYARADTPAAPTPTPEPTPEPDPEALAPSGLSAKVVSGDDGVIEGVALAWDAPAEDAASVTGYEVLRAVGDGEMATLVADTGSTGASYTDDTATEAGESYAYRVKALRGQEASQPSNGAEAFIPKTTPVEPEPPIAERQSGHVEVWSATLFLADIGGSLGCSNDNASNACSQSGILTDDDFDYDGVTYTVTAITLATAGTLEIDVSATPTEDTIADLVLNVDTNNVFRLSDATVSGSTLSWASTGRLDYFTEGRYVVLSLNAGNRPPGFGFPGDREVPENSPAGTDVGAPVTANDLDGDTLTYTLEGTEAASFDIVSSTGQIQTISGVAYDFETKQSYFVTVKADDGNGGTATYFMAISLIDVDEPPAAPAAPAVSPVSGSSDSLEVSWTVPDNTGKPAIDSYDLQYRQGTSGIWTDGPQDETGLSATITGLDADTEHQVRVRATNHEGDSMWSASGTGSTNAPADNITVVWTATLTPGEIGGGYFGCSNESSLTCSSSNRLTDDSFTHDSTTYSISDFYLHSGTLELNVGANPSATTIADLTLNVSGSPFPLSDADVNGSRIEWTNTGLSWTAGTDVTVSLTEEAEAVAPTVSSVVVTSHPGADETYAIGDTIQVTVTFGAAVTVDTSGGTPRIQLRIGGILPEHTRWANYASGSGNEALVFAYTVQAADMDADGISIEADELYLNGGTIQSTDGTDANLTYTQLGIQSGHKVDGSPTNAAPEFDTADTDILTVPENSPAGTSIGPSVTANDADSDTLTYTLEGTDAALVRVIDSSSGQITTIVGRHLRPRGEVQLLGHGQGGRQQRRDRHHHRDDQPSPTWTSRRRTPGGPLGLGSVGQHH